MVYEHERKASGEVTLVDSPSKLPAAGAKGEAEVREPYVRLEVFTPSE